MVFVKLDEGTRVARKVVSLEKDSLVLKASRTPKVDLER